MTTRFATDAERRLAAFNSLSPGAVIANGAASARPVPAGTPAVAPALEMDWTRYLAITRQAVTVATAQRAALVAQRDQLAEQVRAQLAAITAQIVQKDAELKQLAKVLTLLANPEAERRGAATTAGPPGERRVRGRPSEWPARLAAWAAQHDGEVRMGEVARATSASIGAARTAMTRLVEAGTWERVSLGVYRPVAAALVTTQEQEGGRDG